MKLQQLEKLEEYFEVHRNSLYEEVEQLEANLGALKLKLENLRKAEIVGEEQVRQMEHIEEEIAGYFQKIPQKFSEMKCSYDDFWVEYQKIFTSNSEQENVDN